MVSQTNATERKGYRKTGKSMLHNRKTYPRQEGLDRGMKQPILFYDSGLSEN